MGCMSSKQLEPVEVEVLPEISWPTECYRNPGVLPSTLAIGYPFPYSEEKDNSMTKTGLIYCATTMGPRRWDGNRRNLRHNGSQESMENAL